MGAGKVAYGQTASVVDTQMLGELEPSFAGEPWPGSCTHLPVGWVLTSAWNDVVRRLIAPDRPPWARIASKEFEVWAG